MKVLLNSFHLNGHTLGFHQQTKRQNHLAQQSKQYHMNALLSSFDLNGHTLGFQSLRLNKVHAVSAIGFPSLLLSAS